MGRLGRLLGEEVEIYRRAIRIQTKFDMERTVKSLNEEEYENCLKLWKHMRAGK